VPGFAVFLEVGGAAAGAEWVEVESEAILDSASGNQVPDAVAPDEGGEEVDIGWSVGNEVRIAAPMTAHGEGSVAVEVGCLYLNAPDVTASVHHDVVMLAVAEWLGDGEPVAGGLEHEVQFGQVANVLGVSSRSSFAPGP